MGGIDGSRALSFQLFRPHQSRQTMGHTARHARAWHNSRHHLLRNDRLHNHRQCRPGKDDAARDTGIAAGARIFAMAFVVLYIAAMYIGCAITAKRLHDRNKSAWWLLVF